MDGGEDADGFEVLFEGPCVSGMEIIRLQSQTAGGHTHIECDTLA